MESRQMEIVNTSGSVIHELLNIVDVDPLPANHTSSHWIEYGTATTVSLQGDTLNLNGIGFGNIHVGGFREQLLMKLERLSYWRYTRHLKTYKSIRQVAKRLAAELSFNETFDIWKQIVALSVLCEHFAEFDLKPQTFVLIGDGHGFLGALIHRVFTQARIYSIDLPKVLVFQACTHKLADPHASTSIVGKDSTPSDISFVHPSDIELIQEDVDCAINIASMQEMTEQSIYRYFEFLRRRSGVNSRFYCVNRIKKDLPYGQVTKFSDYPWHVEDDIFVDGLCQYYTHYFGTTKPCGPALFGKRIPLINSHPAIRHRLVHLSKLHRPDT